jgi:hypothetical protein
MRRLLFTLSLALVPIAVAQAQVSIGIAVPGVSIGINLPTYPALVRVPGYPVYYDPRGNSNYFFYDGQYWVYRGDNWYASSWYNGPWVSVHPEYVPLYVLRVPVRYYRQPPTYFRGWRADAAPRWGEHWGHDWEARRTGWNQWNRNEAPRAAPLPTYQRQYRDDRYPGSLDQQREIRTRNYSYQPRESITQQHYQPREAPQARPPERSSVRGPEEGSRGRDTRDDSQGNDRGDRPESQGKGRDRHESQGKGRDKKD